MKNWVDGLCDNIDCCAGRVGLCRLQSVTKEGLSFGDEDVTEVKKREKYYKRVFAPLSEFLKETFKGKISKVGRLLYRVDLTACTVQRRCV